MHPSLPTVNMALERGNRALHEGRAAGVACVLTHPPLRDDLVLGSPALSLSLPVCVCVHTHTDTHTHTHTHTQTDSHTHTQVHTDTHTHTSGRLQARV